MKISFRIAVPCALVLGFAAGAAQAQYNAPVDREVWGESSRTQVWMNAYGQCWQSAFGPPPAAGVCGIPVPVAAVVPVVAPVVVAPPPQRAPAPVVSAAPPAPPAPAPYVAPAAPKRDRN